MASRSSSLRVQDCHSSRSTLEVHTDKYFTPTGFNRSQIVLQSCSLSITTHIRSVVDVGQHPTATMTITLHLVRHAQGFHNLNHVNEAIPDPYLTPLGQQQCAALRSAFPFHETVTHLVASPMRRTLLTCYHSFLPSVLSTSNPSGKQIIALPFVQEISANPCDTGSEPAMLRAEFGNLREDGGAAWLDDSHLERGWNDKISEDSRWAPRPDRLEARAREARRWLRELGRDGQGDKEIVVVTHGGFLHFLTQDWDGMDVAKGMLYFELHGVDPFLTTLLT